MAKDKSLTNPPKRKKLGSNVSELHAEETMDTKIKKKRKKMDVEVSNAVSCIYETT